jgi:hypothetical protein
MKWISNFLPFNWFFTKIKESMNDHLGKASATRINGYIITILITISIFTCLYIEVSSALSAIETEGGTYTISVQLITLIGMLIGHHSLLFQLKRKSEETNFPTLDNLNELSVKTGIPVVDDDNDDEEFNRKEK